MLVNVMLSVVLASVYILLERVISSALSGTYCGVVPQPLFPAARAGTAHSIITAASAKQISLRVFMVQSSLTVLFSALALWPWPTSIIMQFAPNTSEQTINLGENMAFSI